MTTQTRDMFIVVLGAALMRMEMENLTVGQTADLLIRMMEREGYCIERRTS
jgi:hypothetical protein